MSRILIVDDEPRYRDYLNKVFAEEGHDVRVADSGRAGIDVGARFRPDVLVADWMLKDHVHGLHLAAALRAVRPDLQPILVTGYPSEDLATAASEEGFSDFVRKPFDIDRMRRAVARAADRHDVIRVPFGVVELDPSDHIVYASPKAREMATEAGVPYDASIGELLGGQASSGATDTWITVTVGSERWSVRAQPRRPDGGRLVVLVPNGNRVNETTAEMLLGLWEPGTAAWPRTGRVLVVDDNALVRTLSASLIEQAGTTCYTAPTHERALDLARADPGLEVVLLDYDMPDGDVGELVRGLRTARPDLLLVGNSGLPRGPDFRQRGVSLFLQKPWRLDALISIVGPAH